MGINDVNYNSFQHLMLDIEIMGNESFSSILSIGANNIYEMLYFLELINNLIMEKYKIIYADPPWSFNNKNTGGSMKSGSDAHYDTMNLNDICNLPMDQITNEDCVLFMWWVASQPLEALKVIESWGFTLKTMCGFDWVKVTKNGKLHFGMGFWTRMGSEACLIAVKGKPKRINAGVRSVELVDSDYLDIMQETYFAEVGKHSEKPDIFRDRIVELMGDIPRIELFARKQTDGWAVFGNEVENSVSLLGK